jgi:hypothetical protein
MTRALVVVFIAAFSIGSMGCTHVRPWERGKLAHPTMTSASLPGPAEEHLYSVQEGAVGGAAGVESGCGCN